MTETSREKKAWGRQALTVCLAAIACLALLSGCDSEEEEGTSEPFEIGLVLPLTGSGESAGESMEAAINLAVDDVNAYLEDIGDPLRVEITIRDSETEPSVALEQLKDLDQQGIRYVIGPYSSASVAAVLSYANENGMVVLSPSSVASELAIAGDNLFRLAPADTKQAEAISALFGHDGVSVILPVVRDDVWGQGLLHDLGQIAEQTGLDVEDPTLYDPDNLNAAAIASDIAASVGLALGQYPPSEVAVYLLSFGEGTDILGAAATEPDAGLVRWYGSSAFAKNAELAANSTAATFAMERMLRCPSFAPDPAAADLWQPFTTHLESILGREPEVYALTANDAVWLMAQARREQRDETDVESFKSALVRVAKYQVGITGRLVFNEFGDREQSAYDFWGLTEIVGSYTWRSFGQFSSTGDLIIF